MRASMIASTSGRCSTSISRRGCPQSFSASVNAATFEARLARPSFTGHRSRRCPKLHAVKPPDEEEGGGTGLLEKPNFDRSAEDSQVLPDNYYGSTESPPRKGLGGGDWRVMLLDSPTHTEQLVVRVLTTVISSVDEQQAKNCFSTSKQLGQALVISCLKEHAEFFTQMLNRQGVRSIIEPDSTTL